MYNATPDCTCLMDQIGNRRAISSSFFHFLSTVEAHTWPRHVRLASQGQDPCEISWSKKRPGWEVQRMTLEARFKASLFINTAVSKYRSGCQTLFQHHSRFYRFCAIFLFFFISSASSNFNFRLTALRYTYVLLHELRILFSIHSTIIALLLDRY